MFNKKGESFITPCIVMMVLCSLLSLFIAFVSAVNVVRISKRNTKNVLDSFVMQNSIEIYDSVKTGSNQTAEIDRNAFLDYFCTYSDLTVNGSNLVAYDADGNESYRIEGFALSFAAENELNLQVQYTVIVPVSFGDFTVTKAAVPVTVKAKFDPKF